MPKQRSSREIANPLFTRRDLLQAAAFGLFGASASGWMPAFAEALAGSPVRRRHCVLLWMSGGPSQMDTFDLKPEHKNGGEFKPIDTSVPGLQISEHLPKLASMAEHLAVIRSLSTKEGDHSRGTYLMRTGHRPGGPIQYPTLGSLISKELGTGDAELPNFVSVAPFRVFNRQAYQSGFLGPKYAALTVGAADSYQRVQPQTSGYANLKVDDLHPPDSIESAQADGRLELLNFLQSDFVARHRTDSPVAHKTVYERAVRMMRSKAAGAFDLSQEPDEVRDAYGRGQFGQGCLMARRLIEQGVPFIEVSLGRSPAAPIGWDTHANNFNTVKTLSAALDAGWSSLMSDLHVRGLLESTTIIWMGEFGRTPQLRANRNGGGRDHYPKAWTAVLAGGGIQGGQAYGRTSKDGATVRDGQTDVGDVLVTLCHAMGIDPSKQNLSGVGRPIRMAEGKPIKEVLA